jgi:hypothetical protein
VAGKLLWLGSVLAVAMASVVTTRLVIGAPPAPVAATPSADIETLNRRLARLEAEPIHRGRSLAQAIQLQAGSAGAAPAAEGADEGTPEQQLARQREREASRAEREARHYDELDRQARASGGPAATAATAQLRSNLQALRNLPADKGRVELDVAALDCGDKLCRLELKSGTTANPATLIPQLLQGMGNLSMRPARDGKPVYYIAARDQRLPAIGP